MFVRPLSQLVGFLMLGALAITPCIAMAEATSGGTQEVPQAVRDVLPSIVKISAQISPRARSASTLGAEREGQGVVIGDDGLVLTIGYLILEAEEVVVTWGNGRKLPASVVAYDYETGFGLIRAAIPLKVPSVRLGDSDPLATKDDTWVAGYGGEATAYHVLVASRREFAGFWEYLLENAIFTTPPYPMFAGAPLLSPKGELLGIGSLVVPDALGSGHHNIPGNLFVPINRLKPILAGLLQKGRSDGQPKPWLGIYVLEELGRVTIANVADGGPAAAAGLLRGDIVAAINGQPVTEIAELYRKLWGMGNAGIEVRLQVERATVMREFTVKTADRYKFLRLDNSY